MDHRFPWQEAQAFHGPCRKLCICARWSKVPVPHRFWLLCYSLPCHRQAMLLSDPTEKLDPMSLLFYMSR